MSGASDVVAPAVQQHARRVSTLPMAADAATVASTVDTASAAAARAAPAAAAAAASTDRRVQR